MRTNVFFSLIGLCFVLSLFSCTDHRLGGVLSPVRLRLKTVQGGTINTTYTYDNQNRPATITKADGSLSVYVYDDAQQSVLLNQYPNPANRTTGTAIVLPPNFSTLPAFTVYSYPIINSVRVSSTVIDFESYSTDGNNHVTFVGRGVGDPGRVFRFYNYTYTGENITRETLGENRSIVRISTYEYDTAPNPFFGLTDPDLSDLSRFSRNNVVKETANGSGYTDRITTYEYEYNPQGLPTRRITRQEGVITETLTFGYEAY